MSDCRQGKRISVNGIIYKNIPIEIKAELSILTNIEAIYQQEMIINDIESQAKSKIIDMFDLNNIDKKLNNIQVFIS